MRTHSAKAAGLSPDSLDARFLSSPGERAVIAVVHGGPARPPRRERNPVFVKPPRGAERPHERSPAFGEIGESESPGLRGREGSSFRPHLRSWPGGSRCSFAQDAPMLSLRRNGAAPTGRDVTPQAPDALASRAESPAGSPRSARAPCEKQRERVRPPRRRHASSVRDGDLRASSRSDRDGAAVERLGAPARPSAREPRVGCRGSTVRLGGPRRGVQPPTHRLDERIGRGERRPFATTDRAAIPGAS